MSGITKCLEVIQDMVSNRRVARKHGVILRATLAILEQTCEFKLAQEAFQTRPMCACFLHVVAALKGMLNGRCVPHAMEQLTTGRNAIICTDCRDHTKLLTKEPMCLGAKSMEAIEMTWAVLAQC